MGYSSEGIKDEECGFGENENEVAIVHSNPPAIVYSYLDDATAASSRLGDEPIGHNKCEAIFMIPCDATDIDYQIDDSCLLLTVTYNWPQCMSTVSSIMDDKLPVGGFYIHNA